MSFEWNASLGADQSSGIFLVRALPELRRFGAMRQLQHLHDASQAAQPPRMPLLRLDSGYPEPLSEVPVEVCLFFWRRLRALGGTPAERIPRRADCAAGSRYRAHQAPISGNARSVRRRRAGYSRG